MSARKKAVPRKEEEPASVSAPGRSFWSGTITFGLVSIPVDFYAATRPRAGSLRMVTDDGNPVGRRYVCPRDGRPVPTDEIVRGFQVESGEYVVLSDEDLDAVAPDKTRDIDLKRFLPLGKLPTLLFARPYILTPAGTSTKAYRLLAETMEQSSQAGIATFVMRDKAYIVAILAKGGVLLAETLRFPDELRTPANIGLPKPVRVRSGRIKDMIATIDRLTRKELDLEELSDDYAAQLEKLARDKAKRGKEVIETTEAAEFESVTEMAAPIDLVALLKERLERSGAVPGPRKTSPGRPEKKPKKSGALDQKPRSDLYERAKKLGIEGRSRMTKLDLVEAIQKAAS